MQKDITLCEISIKIHKKKNQNLIDYEANKKMKRIPL